MGDALVAPPEELHVFGETLQRKTTGAQLFDILESENDMLLQEDGSVKQNSSYHTSGFVPVIPGEQYRRSETNTIGNFYYDIDKTFIVKDSNADAISVPENCKYLRFSYVNTIENIMVNKGTSLLPYEPYTGGKPSPSPEYPQEIVSAGSVMTTGAQLLNSDEMIIGGLSGNTGEEFETSTRIRTGYIPVKAGIVYSLSGYNGYKVANAHIYDSSKTRINNFTVSAPIPEQGAYVRISFGKKDDTDFTEDELSIFKKSLMFNEGETALPYEPYTGGKPAVNPEAGEIGVDVYGGNLLPTNKEESFTSAKGFTGLNLTPGVYCISASSIASSDTDYNKSAVYVFGKDTNETILSILFERGKNVSQMFTIPDGKVSKLMYIYASNGYENSVDDTATFYGLTVCRRSEPLPYEPYKSPQAITFPTPGGLPGIPVSSDGTYTDSDGQQWVCDSIEYRNGKLAYVQRVKWIEFDGSADEEWSLYSNETYKGFLTVIDEMKPSDLSSGYCNLLPVDVKVSSTFPGIWLGTTSTRNPGKGMYVHNVNPTYATTVEEWETWLQSNPIKVLYQLETPIETEITDPETINQLKSLRLNSPNTTIMNDANAFQKLKYLKETFTMANVNFRFGTYEQYKALGTKDTNTLYFVDGVIYKGDAPYSQKVEMVSAFPETDNAAQGVLYVNSSTYESKFFNGTDFTTVFVGTVGNMDDAGNDNKVVTQAAVKAYVTKQLADADIPTDGAIDEKINAAKEEAITEAVSQAGTAADEKDATLKTQLEQTMDTKIAAQVASVFRFKGSKANKDEIDAIEGMVTGDVWHSEDDGKEYVYDGEAWELLGFTVDLSAYATTAAVTEAINAKAAELTTAIGQAKDEAVNTAKSYTDTQLGAHTGNAEIHITKEERAAWNAKADTSYVDTAKQAAIDAAAADATTKANQALTDAKTYADGLNTAMDTRMKAVEAAVTWGEIA